MKQAPKIELQEIDEDHDGYKQEIDEDHDGYKAKEKVARAFIGLIVMSEWNIKNGVVFRVFLFVIPLCTWVYHCTRVGECRTVYVLGYWFR